jgi:tetratricopeptide (TPR) repeat protein
MHYQQKRMKSSTQELLDAYQTFLKEHCSTHHNEQLIWSIVNKATGNELQSLSNTINQALDEYSPSHPNTLLLKLLDVYFIKKDTTNIDTYDTLLEQLLECNYDTEEHVPTKKQKLECSLNINYSTTHWKQNALLLVYHRRASILISQLEFEDAISDCSECIEIDPEYAPAYCMNAKCLIEEVIYMQNEGIRGTAHVLNPHHLEIINKAIEIDPNYTEAYMIKARMESMWRDCVNALIDCNIVIEHEPDNVQAYRLKAKIYWDGTEEDFPIPETYDVIIAELSKCIQLDPLQSDFYYFRAKCWKKICCYDEAICDYSRCIELDNGHYLSYTKRAKCLLKLGRLTEALSDVNEALRIDGELSESYRTRAMIYLQLGRYSDCITECNEQLKDFLEMEAKERNTKYHKGFVNVLLIRRSAYMNLQCMKSVVTEKMFNLDIWMVVIEHLDTRSWIQLSYTCSTINRLKYNENLMINKQKTLKFSALLKTFNQTDSNMVFNLRIVEPEDRKLNANYNMFSSMHHLTILNVKKCNTITDAELKLLPNLTILNASYCQKITGEQIKQMTRLKVLLISFCSQITDEVFKDLNNLEILDVFKCGVTTDIFLNLNSNIKALKLPTAMVERTMNYDEFNNFNSLEEIKVNSTILKSIAKRCLSSVKRLTISSQYEDLDDETLKIFNNLQVLHMWKQTNITDSVFQLLPGLTSLSISACVQLTDTAISHLTNLKTLSISSCSQITNDGLKNLVKLRELTLQSCCQHSITNQVFASFPELVTLDISYCSQLTEECLKYMSPYLSYLFIHKSGVSSDAVQMYAHYLPSLMNSDVSIETVLTVRSLCWLTDEAKYYDWKFDNSYLFDKSLFSAHF